MLDPKRYNAPSARALGPGCPGLRPGMTAWGITEDSPRHRRRDPAIQSKSARACNWTSRISYWEYWPLHRCACRPAYAAGETDQAEPECRKAEVNPVTGHVLCVEPLGAAVEAPPSDAMSPCEPLKHDGDFTYAPNCKDKPSG
jgi:hypothetical protein